MFKSPYPNKEKPLLTRLLHPTSFKKFLFFLVSDVILITASLYLAFLFHFDFNFNIYYFSLVWEALPWFMGIKLVSFFIFRIYKITWRSVGLFDALNMVLALTLSGVVLILLTFVDPSFFHTDHARIPQAGHRSRHDYFTISNLRPENFQTILPGGPAPKDHSEKKQENHYYRRGQRGRNGY